MARLVETGRFLPETHSLEGQVLPRGYKLCYRFSFARILSLNQPSISGDVSR